MLEVSIKKAVNRVLDIMRKLKLNWHRKNQPLKGWREQSMSINIMKNKTLKFQKTLLRLFNKKRVIIYDSKNQAMAIDPLQEIKKL